MLVQSHTAQAWKSHLQNQILLSLWFHYHQRGSGSGGTVSTSAPEQQGLEQYVSGAPEGVGCVEESILGGVVWEGLSEEVTFELRS